MVWKVVPCLSPSFDQGTGLKDQQRMAAQDFWHSKFLRLGSLPCVIGVNFRENGFYSSYTRLLWFLYLEIYEFSLKTMRKLI
jgi:hypothetical protein